MKNVKLNLKKAAKAGFSLVEMLVVIAIIGIIAAIAIPNIGSINDAAKDSAAQRNAQNAASVWNAAIAAGYDASAVTTAQAAVDLLEGDTVTGDPDGPFATNVFKTGAMSNETDVVPLLTLGADKSLVYVKP
jgi:prepilin-type N-terminal cleavage/methylation domain-containing protein